MACLSPCVSALWLFLQLTISRAFKQEGISNVSKTTKPTARRQALLIVSALSLALGACAESSIQTLSTNGAIAAFRALPNSRKAPCQIQRAIAEHNSVYATLRSGKETVYKAPCDVDKPEAKTS